MEETIQALGMNMPLVIVFLSLAGSYIILALVCAVCRLIFKLDTSRWYLVRFIRALTINTAVVPLLIGAIRTGNVIGTAITAGVAGFCVIHLLLNLGFICMSIYIDNIDNFHNLANLEEEQKMKFFSRIKEFITNVSSGDYDHATKSMNEFLATGKFPDKAEEKNPDYIEATVVEIPRSEIQTEIHDLTLQEDSALDEVAAKKNVKIKRTLKIK